MKLDNKIFFLLFLFSSIVYSTNYYLDSKNGKDSNNGTTPQTAWQTIDKINNSRFLPGDKILFKRGLEWREQLVVSFSGTSDNPVIIGAYGNGTKPKIKGSDVADKWKKYSGIIWQAKFKVKPYCIYLVDDDGAIHWGKEHSVISSLKENYDFVWKDSVLYLYLGKNPSKTFPTVECSVRDFGIVNDYDKMGQNYITIENLEISYALNANIRAIGVKGWTIKNCTLHHSGITDESDGQGIQYEGEDGFFSNNEIYENGQHGIFLSSFGTADVKNNVIEKNIVYNNYHTGIDLMNDGGSENSHRNSIIRYNLVYEEEGFKGLEVGIQTLGYGNGLVKNVIIHHNIVVHVNGIGISAVPNSDSIFIHNNTIYETESTCINIDNDNYYAEVFNNIGINHIYYAPFFVEKSTNKKVDYNIWNTNQESFIYIDGEYPETWKEGYVDKYGFDKHGSNKELEIQLTGLIPEILNANAPSIDAGKELNYKVDYLGKPINNKLDIGAIEFR